MLICEKPTIATTILGSCVSVMMFSVKAGVGGITHYALPERKYAVNSGRNDHNFGDQAIQSLYHALLRCKGVEKKDLSAKIVGGGNVMDDLSRSTSIGELNIEIARQTLKKLNVPVCGESVGGLDGKKIYFYTDSGRVRVSNVDTRKKFITPDTKKKTEVLIVDDSKTMRDLLSKILACDEIEVVGTAADALEAEAFMKKRLPDVVTLDIHMPGMDGVTFLRKYLPVHPIPTVMISSINIHESDLVLKALEYGAVDYIQKPTLSEISAMTANMREKIITASKIKVKKKELLQKVTSQRASHSLKSGFDKIVAIGASTGGTEAIKEVLMALPVNIPPIVIVQHIPPVFSTAFARRLNELCPFEVTEGVDGEELRPGKVIIAPGGLQMELIKMGSVYKVKVFDGERVNRHKPSVDVLFNSVAKLLGKDAVGVILTGMGDDGAQGLLRMKNAGAYTIAQDEASSVVYGMPRAAALLGGVQHVSPLDQVAHAIVKTLEKGKAA